MKRRLHNILILCCIVAFNATAASNVRAATIYNGPRELQQIALTFDACPARGMKVDWGVIDALISSQTPATLFLSGKWMEKFPEETKRLAATPLFEIGLHSYSHPHMTKMSEPQMAEQLRKNQEILQTLTGKTARYFRPPFAETSPTLERVAASLGLTVVMYDFASGDPSEGMTKNRLTSYFMHNIRSGELVVMHMNGHGWHTAEALPEIIQRSKENGFTFVTTGTLDSENRQRAAIMLSAPFSMPNTAQKTPYNK